MVLGIPGTDNIMPSMNWGGVATGVGFVILAFIVFVFLAACIWYYFHWKNKDLNKKKIHWFEEINGHMVPIGLDIAEELTVPGTNVQVFYIKRKDMYLPRPVKAMGKDSYWFCIKSNRELVNFTMKNMNKEFSEAGLDYDHTDMRYALNNLRELIKRNYRDKATPWWQEYKEVIGLVVLIFVLSVSFFFLLSKIGGLIGQLGGVAEQIGNMAKNVAVLQGSGVAAA